MKMKIPALEDWIQSLRNLKTQTYQLTFLRNPKNPTETMTR
jgi:hypothetical protein